MFFIFCWGFIRLGQDFDKPSRLFPSFPSFLRGIYVEPCLPAYANTTPAYANVDEQMILCISRPGSALSVSS